MKHPAPEGRGFNSNIIANPADPPSLRPKAAASAVRERRGFRAEAGEFVTGGESGDKIGTSRHSSVRLHRFGYSAWILDFRVRVSGRPAALYPTAHFANTFRIVFTPTPRTPFATGSRAFASPWMWIVRWMCVIVPPGFSAAAGDDVSSS